jgi:hypothetical protein
MLATVLIIGLIFQGSETGRLFLNSDEFDWSEIPTRKFSIPISLGVAARRDIDRLELYISEDNGRTWIEITRCPAENHAFDVEIEAWPNGRSYWFGMRIVMKDGTALPSKIGDVRAEQRFRINGATIDLLVP